MIGLSKDTRIVLCDQEGNELADLTDLVEEVTVGGEVISYMIPAGELQKVIPEGNNELEV